MPTSGVGRPDETEGQAALGRSARLEGLDAEHARQHQLRGVVGQRRAERDDGAGLSVATLSGTYFAVGMEAANMPPPEWESSLLYVTADGAGNLGIAGGFSNEDGTVTAVPAGPAGTYPVAPDGALGIGGGSLVGGVSPSGNFAVFGGGIGGGDNPVIWFMMR